MSSNETIIVTESNSGHSETTVIEVIGATPETLIETADEAGHVTVIEVFEAILDPTPDLDLPGSAAEIHEYIVTEAVDYAAPSELASSGSSSADADHVDLEAQAHADAAVEAQQHADEAVGLGDYETAAHAREDAENKAWEAGNSDALHGSSSADLDLAANQQAEAHEFEQQEARDAQAGDYEAARDDAAHAADATGWADYNAGGSDHTGQADQEYQQEDWAVWEDESSMSDHQSAEAYAADGDWDHADQFEANAVDHQELANHHGAQGEHDGDIAVHDHSSDTSYDTAHESYDDAAYSHDSSSDS